MTKKTIYEQIDKVSLTNDERGKYGDGFEDAVNQLREAIKIQKESESKNLFFLGLKKGVVRTTINLALRSLEEENEIPYHFDIIYSIDESEEQETQIRLSYTKDYDVIDNIIDGVVESRSLDFKWEDITIVLESYTNEKGNFETIKNQNSLHKTKKLMFNTEQTPCESAAIKLYNRDEKDGYWVPKDTNLYASYIYKPNDETLSIFDKIKMHSKEFASDCLDGRQNCLLYLYA